MAQKAQSKYRNKLKLRTTYREHNSEWEVWGWELKKELARQARKAWELERQTGEVGEMKTSRRDLWAVGQNWLWTSYEARTDNSAGGTPRLTAFPGQETWHIQTQHST